MPAQVVAVVVLAPLVALLPPPNCEYQQYYTLEVSWNPEALPSPPRKSGKLLAFLLLHYPENHGILVLAQKHQDSDQVKENKFLF